MVILQLRPSFPNLVNSMKTRFENIKISMINRKYAHWFFTVLLFIGSYGFAAEKVDFSGSWLTTFGPMTLKQDKSKVEGQYNMGGHICSLKGTVEGRKLTFTYQEPTIGGKGWFELSADGQLFSGQWLEDQKTVWAVWEGKRGEASAVAATTEEKMDGLWLTTYGPMRLVARGKKVEGIYAGTNSIQGEFKNGKFDFTYAEGKVTGEGSFTLASNDQKFSGQWRPKGESQWKSWEGKRVPPYPDMSWLIVIEVPWERSLQESEYSFGGMLKSFFTRAPNVQVRQRIVNNEHDLLQFLQEVPYIPEPTVVSISSHGSRGMVEVGGATVPLKTIAEALKYSSNTKLLHFGGCEVLKGITQEDLISLSLPMPLSGYKQSVDWAQSAIFEFALYEFLLTRNRTVKEAVRELQTVFPLAFSTQEKTGGVFKNMEFVLLQKNH